MRAYLDDEAADGGGHHNFENLKAHIVRLSVEQQDWRKAFAEWEGIGSERLSEGETAACPCGQSPIVELCYIQNTKNERMTYVGNVCINRFMSDYEVGTFFKALRSAKTAKRLPEEIAWHAYRRGWITSKAHDFYLEKRTKRKLTPKQRAWRDDIERTVRHRLKVEVAAEKAYAEQRGLLAVPERRSE